MSVIEVLSEDAEDVTAHHHPPHLQRTTHHKDKHESLVHLHFSLRSTIILVSARFLCSLLYGGYCTVATKSDLHMSRAHLHNVCF